MVVHQGFNSFSNCSSRLLLEDLKHSSSCILKCKFFQPCLLRWCYVILDKCSSCFMIHKLSRMRYLNPSCFSSFKSFQPIIFLVGVFVVWISPNAFPKDCCYYDAYQLIQVLLLFSVKEVFISPRSQASKLFPLVAEFHLKC
jgi:hypothetical protein